MYSLIIESNLGSFIIKLRAEKTFVVCLKIRQQNMNEKGWVSQINRITFE
jgi:hypothetical protein